MNKMEDDSTRFVCSPEDRSRESDFIFATRLSSLRIFTFADERRPGLIHQLKELLRKPSEAWIDSQDHLKGSRCRLAIVASSVETLNGHIQQAIERLESNSKSSFTSGSHLFYREVSEPPAKTALLFPGFGASHPTLFEDLYQHFPSIRKWFHSFDSRYRERFLDNPELFPNQLRPARTSEATVAKIQRKYLYHIDCILLSNLACYHVVSNLLGLQADTMMGHSIGENSMLVASGCIPNLRNLLDMFENLSGKLPTASSTNEDWSMVIVSASARQCLEQAEHSAFSSLTPAMHNCPQQSIYCVRSRELPELKRLLARHNEMASVLPNIDFPVHNEQLPFSHHELIEVYSQLGITDPAIETYSCSIADRITETGDVLIEQLIAQWRTPVRFVDTLNKMREGGIENFIEVGPGGRLTGFTRDSLRGQKCFALPFNIESKRTIDQLMVFVSNLFVRGFSIDLQSFRKNILLAPFESPSERETPTAQNSSGIAGPTTPNHTNPQSERSKKARIRELTTSVLREIASILEIGRDENLDPQLGFFQLGINSIDAVNMVDRLNTQLSISLSPTLLFTYQTPADLASHLDELLNPETTVRDEVRSTVTQTSVSETDKIAIVGMACRFPGKVNNTDELWNALLNRIDAIRPVPDGRWDENECEMDPYLKQGGFIEDIAHFDPGFFEISPKEALTLDPQQRQLLEVTWEALEHANINPETLSGTRTGVFVGISHADYAHRLDLAQRLNEKGYIGIGNAHFTAAGRISFFLGVNGPSIALDTACSSSLVTIHQACRSIQNGECSCAIAGGVQLLTSPESSIYLGQAQALSPQARCRTFDAEADGYVRGEGCGIVILKPLSRALHDRDRIIATIEGSAVNHNGHTSGLTVPGGPAQRSVIESALQAGGVNKEEIVAIEAHGTGTSLGDPIEVQALGDVFGSSRERERIFLGSVKTNLGHLEAAAGVAGVIKAALQLEKRRLLPGLHFRKPNPHIDWEQLPFEVCREIVPWDAFSPPKAIGVSSFGISGTNAHAVLKEFRQSSVTGAMLDQNSELLRTFHILTYSAKSPDALKRQRENYLSYLRDADSPALHDICFSSNIGRAHFPYRDAWVVESKEGARTHIEEALRESSSPMAENLRQPASIAFLFTGQGSQYPKMGYTLYNFESAYRKAFDECETAIRELTGWSLIELITEPGENGSGRIDQTQFAQPAIFALEYSLGRLWTSWGIEPEMMAGHSIGEFAAACLAGVFSLKDAIRLVAERGRLMQSLDASGAMLAVSEESVFVEEFLQKESLDLSVAAINGPKSLVLSGSSKTIEKATKHLQAAQVRTTRLNVSHAFHSALMDPMLDAFRAVAESVEFHSPTIPLVSTMTGKLESDLFATAQYWVDQIRSTVRFLDTVRSIQQLGGNIWIEVGPKPVLISMASRIVQDESILTAPSLRPPVEDDFQILETLALLYRRGIKVNWAAIQARTPCQKVTLPSYPFAREHYWLKADSFSNASSRVFKSTDTLLGDKLRFPDVSDTIRYESVCSQSRPSFWREHRFQEKSYLPNAAILSILRRAASADSMGPSCSLKQVRLLNPVELGPELTVIHTRVSPMSETHRRVEIFSAAESEREWEPVCGAHIAPVDTKDLSIDSDGQFSTTPEISIDRKTFYQTSQKMGLKTDPHFQVIDRIMISGQQAVASVDLNKKTAPNHLDQNWTALLEAAFQTLSALLMQMEPGNLHLVQSIESIHFLPTALSENYEVGVRTIPSDSPGEISADIRIYSANDRQVIVRMHHVSTSREQWKASDSKNGEDQKSGGLIHEILEMDTSQRPARIRRYLGKVTGAILGIRDPAKVAIDVSFNTMGMDSIMAMALRIQLQKDLGIDLPIATRLNAITLNSLTSTVLEQLEHADSPETPPEVIGANSNTWMEGEL